MPGVASTCVAVHRHALRFVDGRGIAVVEFVVILQVEADAAPVIGAHGHALRADLFDGAEGAVLTPRLRRFAGK